MKFDQAIRGDELVDTRTGQAQIRIGPEPDGVTW